MKHKTTIVIQQHHGVWKLFQCLQIVILKWQERKKAKTWHATDASKMTTILVSCCCEFVVSVAAVVAGVGF